MDELFAVNGLEDSDIVIAFQKYNLQESDELKQIMVESKTMLENAARNFI